MNCSSNWCKAKGSDSVTYWANCITYDHTRGLDFELKIKVCNHLISIMREPIGMIQASWYLYPVLPFVDRFHSKLPEIKLKIKNTLNSLSTNKNIFSYYLFHFLLISSFLIFRSGAINFDALHQLLCLLFPVVTLLIVTFLVVALLVVMVSCAYAACFFL